MARRVLFALVLCALVAAPVEARTLQQAVEHVESRGDANATGRHGEIGLMQIKYETARGLGYRGTRKGLYDPATNRKYGAKYLAIALKRAKGNLCRAASLYNMGVAARPRCTDYGQRVIEAMGR